MKKLILLLLIAPSFCFATNYYYANTTSGTNSGTQANPFHGLSSVQSNMSSFNAGDSILAKRGDTFSGTLTVTRSGSLGNPIVFGAYGAGADPVFIGTGSTINYLVYVNNRNYIHFTDWYITDPTINLNDSNQVSKIQRAFTFDGTSTGIVLKNSFIELAGVGVYIPSSVGGCTITNTEMTNLRMVVSSGSGDFGSNPCVLESPNNTITYNYFHDCVAKSVEFGYDGGAVEFYSGDCDNNTVLYNDIFNCLVLSEFGSGSGGTIQDNVLAFNKLINNGCTFYVNVSGGFAVSILNIQLYNNVIVEQRQNLVGDTYMIGLSSAVGTAGQIINKNNVFYLRAGLDVARSGQFTGSQMTHTNNLYNLGSGSVINYTAGVTEITSTAAVWTNTSNSNPVFWDYHPFSGSLLVNAGTNVGISTDYFGASIPPYNIGIGNIPNPPGVIRGLFRIKQL